MNAVKIRWSEINESQMSIELSKSSGQNIKSRMFNLRVGSDTCWLINIRSAKVSKGSVVGQLKLGVIQLTLGRLKSPSIIMFSRGEGKVRMNEVTLAIILSKSDTEHMGGL